MFGLCTGENPRPAALMAFPPTEPRVSTYRFNGLKLASGRYSSLCDSEHYEDRKVVLIWRLLPLRDAERPGTCLNILRSRNCGDLDAGRALLSPVSASNNVIPELDPGAVHVEF